MAILKSLIVNGVTRVIGDLTASKIIKLGGVSSLFLKADGSVDSTSYYHSGNKPSLSDLGAAPAEHTHSYLPLSGGALTGNISVNSRYTFTGDPTGYDYGGLYRNSQITNGGDATTLWLYSYNAIKILGSSVLINGEIPITSGNIGLQSVSYAALAGRLNLTSCYNGTTNNDLWSTIKTSNNSYLGTATIYEVYNDDGPSTYGEVLDIVSVHSNHWQPQLWFDAGKGGRLRYRNKDYNDNSWGDWRTVAWTSDIPTSLPANGGNANTSSYPAGFNLRLTSTWATTGWNMPGTWITGWGTDSGANIAFAKNGSALNVATDGYFYQGADYGHGLVRVMDDWDRQNTVWSNADKLDGEHGSRYTSALGGLNYVTFFVEGDANTYYPVVISGVSYYYPMLLVNISRAYWETAPDTWNTSTHRGGLTLTLLWNGSRYWDGNTAGGACYCVYHSETYSSMVGGLENSTYGKVVWLRGGGAVYHIHSMNGTGVSVTVYTSTFTDSASRTFSPKTSRDEISVRWPGYAQGADYASSAGSASYATSAGTVDKLNTDAGSNVNPIYFYDGKPAACKYTLNANISAGSNPFTKQLAYYSRYQTISPYTETVGDRITPIYLDAGIPKICKGIRFNQYGHNRSGGTASYISGALFFPPDSIKNVQIVVVSNGGQCSLTAPTDDLVGLIVFVKNGSGSDGNVAGYITRSNEPIENNEWKVVTLTSQQSAFFVCMKYGDILSWVQFSCG